jgi:hypothetical protein
MAKTIIAVSEAKKELKKFFMPAKLGNRPSFASEKRLLVCNLDKRQRRRMNGMHWP